MATNIVYTISEHFEWHHISEPILKYIGTKIQDRGVQACRVARSLKRCYLTPPSGFVVQN
ncbi:MAG: hypothetical protein K0R48_62 [Gammaproteobacteria bacterium]|nr:hypothetical protein [Gammaproteobacteria bacterium]